MLTGKLVNLAEDTKRNFGGAFKRLVGRAGEPVIRLAVRQAMRIMGHQFVMGRTIEEALKRSRKGERGYRHSFDMLGEAALTRKDAERYFEAYRKAILAIGKRPGHIRRVRRAQHLGEAVGAAPALRARQARARDGRTDAARAGTGATGQAPGHRPMTIDAEEADAWSCRWTSSPGATRMPRSPAGKASASRCRPTRSARRSCSTGSPTWRAATAAACRCAWSRARTGIREVKRAQVDGHTGYPVFTRKPNTDVSPTSPARAACSRGDAFYPMFATHNAHTIAAIHHGWRSAAGRSSSSACTAWADLIREVIGPRRVERFPAASTRRSAARGSAALPGAPPAGERRQHQLRQPHHRREASHRRTGPDPVEPWRGFDFNPHPRIPQPRDLYGSRPDQFHGREPRQRHRTARTQRQERRRKPWTATPLVPGANPTGAKSAGHQSGRSPRARRANGRPADSATVEKALQNAVAAQPEWDRRRRRRAPRSSNTPRLLEARLPEFIALCTKEAGKTLPTASPRCARRSISAATTRSRRAAVRSRRPCPARPANRTSCTCTGAACSSASARGISRWRSSWAR
jgi:RHH-type proline utilization regulon transcriptional repressor/proline dehydrogenase/delta 1-pyrroline-5-carboxylate dehydrogenase